MKFLIGLVISFLMGAGCRYFDLPVGSPAVVPGAFRAGMTLGYSSTDKLISRQRVATMRHLCGGPTGETVSDKAVAAEDV
jgi:XapX domain-containing protein